MLKDEGDRKCCIQAGTDWLTYWPFTGVVGGDLRAGKGAWCRQFLGLYHFWNLLGVEMLLAVSRAWGWDSQSPHL